MNTISVMIVGVGGQGTLLASKVLGQALVSMDYDVKVSEVHGMSQRGGSVVTYVRYGDEVHSPIVDLGQADYMLAFEPLEAARYLPYLKKDGVIITNTRETMPMPVITGAAAYPENIVEKLKARANVVALDAMVLALEAGNAKAVNMVLMGVLASRMDLPEDVWQAALARQARQIPRTQPPRLRPRAGAEGGLTMAVRQLSVFLENRTGTLCEVTQALSDNGIDVRAITLADTVEFGILRLIVSDPVKAEEVLRAHHFTVSITEVLCVRVDDVPGGLNAVVQLLQKEGISLEYLYAYISKSVDASVIFYVKDCARAEEVLRKNGIRLLSEAY